MIFKVLSYNIHKGFDVWGRFKLEEMKMALLELSVDVLLLQEVVGENRDHIKHFKGEPNERQFEFLADTLWPHYSYGRNAIFPERHHGNAILSKYPIISQHNLDLSTNRFESRGMLHAKIDIFPIQRQLDLFTTHLNLLENGRRQQAHALGDWILRALPPVSPFILTGDFNDWNEAISDDLRRNLSLEECFVALQGRYAKTFPAFWPQLRLDRIYSRGIQPKVAKVLQGPPWNQLSDHLPLYVEFEID